MSDVLFGRCSCGTGNLTVYHLQYECPLTRQPTELSEADREVIRMIMARVNAKRSISKMIKPTIGRVVWYWAAAPVRSVEGAQPNPALVTWVWGDGELVNLVTFDCNGDIRPAARVPLWQGEGEPPAEGHFAEWMPYQKQQAAKESGNTVQAAPQPVAPPPPVPPRS